MIARVLIVDDEEQVRRALATSLTRAGFDVVTVDDGPPAMLLTETFELVLVDFNLKAGVTGVDVVRHFKSRFGAGVYCAVLSGEDDRETRAACLDAGADDVFVKPASPVELKRRLVAAAEALRGLAA
ncbi:MAG: response regulator transcription factor [Deltaproteobacteria bacterium]|nr:response regulator transcription factor [Deltaproteobacteria bacterium]